MCVLHCIMYAIGVALLFVAAFCTTVFLIGLAEIVVMLVVSHIKDYLFYRKKRQLLKKIQEGWTENPENVKKYIQEYMGKEGKVDFWN